MALRFNRLTGPLLLCVSIAAWSAADEKTEFRPRAAAAYAHKQTTDKVTIAAEPFQTDDQAREAFGKVNPWRSGVLPVLIVIQNDGPNTLRLDHMKIRYTLPDRTRVESTPAQDLKYLMGAKKPSMIPGPIGKVKITRGPKNPFTEWEIEGRAFAAKMIPPGQSASGFFYFQTGESSQAASVYITGLEDARTGQELYYFEIPMSGS